MARSTPRILRRLTPRVLAVAGGILLAAALAWLGFARLSAGDEPRPVPGVGADAETYRSERFGFAIDVPAGWRVYEGSDPYVPVINVYPPIVTAKPPFDQAADVVAVSIFPQGIRNTFILGGSEKRDREEGVVTNFKLESGETWATRLVPAEPPKSWKPWGFVWARARVTGLSFGCRRDGEEIPYGDCDPTGGDDVIRRGTLDAASAKLVTKMLESFRFEEPKVEE